jgi:hypothetical protein
MVQALAYYNLMILWIMMSKNNLNGCALEWLAFQSVI